MINEAQGLNPQVPEEKTPEEEEEARFLALEEAEKKAEENIEATLKKKMGITGTALDFVSKKFLGVSLKDMLKDPDSPFGDFLRGLFGVELNEKDLNLAKNPFAGEKVKDQEGESNIVFKEGITPASLDQIQDQKVQTMLKSLQKFSVCQDLEVTGFDWDSQQVTFQAQNWDQVVFLRKFLPRTKVPEKFTEFTTQHKNLLPKEMFSQGKKEYKGELKTDFPDVVAVNSTGKEVQVGWQSAQETQAIIERAVALQDEQTPSS